MLERPWLEERAAISPRHLALATTGRTVTYAGLAERVRRRATDLRALGVRSGNRVAALVENGLEFVELLHALDACGAALLPLNLRLTERELAFQLRDAEAGWLAHGEDERAATLLETMPEIGAIPLRRAPSGSRASDTPLQEQAVRPDAVRAIVYTSGTTGQPKGAVLTRWNFQWSAIASAFHLGMLPTDRWLVCMPPYHVGGLAILVRCALYGITAVLHDRFDAERVSRAIDREGITITSLVPTMLKRLLDARRDRPPPAQLRVVLLGGAPVSRALLERAFRARFPVALSYGLTEATSQVATRAPDPRRLPSEGDLVPLLGTRLRVVDERGGELPACELGEICVRGPTVMRGYVNRPRQTAEALRGGWLHTGDLGTLDEQGRLRVLDRRRDLILSGGENVSPAEVERVLLEHPDVAEAAVASVADRELGSRPVAWVVSSRRVAPEAHALRAFCRERLAAYKVPSAFRFVTGLPRSSTGKLLRERLSDVHEPPTASGT